MAVRAHQALEGYEIGDNIEWSDIFSTETKENYLTRPTCPCGGEYILVEKFPPKGTPAASCEHTDSKNHRPEDTTHW